jgi:HEAT repeat protein
LLQSIASFGPWFEHHAQQLSTYPEVNLALLNAMGRTYGFNQVPIINAIMKHERNTIIVRGLAALSKLHSIEAIEIIGGYLLNHDSRYVRRNAAEDLGKTKQLTALKYLEQVDNDISNGVRDSVKRSIERINKAHC